MIPLVGRPSFFPTELPNSFSDTHGWTLTYIVGGAGIALIIALVILARPKVSERLSATALRRLRLGITVLLSVAALLSVLLYHDFGLFRYGTYYNEWDLFHYYLGTKYAPEVGYTDLYGAALVADQETGLKYASPTLRDLTTYERVDTTAVLADGARYKRRFTEARWAAFRADVAWFKAQFPPNRWRLILDDHGYNGTPAWTFLAGGLLTRHLSIRSPVGRFIMLVLDPLLWVAGFLCVAWAYGFRASLLTVILVGTHYLMSWGHMKGALLRTDFAIFTLMAVCLVKKRRHGAAGALLGLATLSRVFPVVFLAGPAVKLVAPFIRERRVDRAHLRLFAGFAVTLFAVFIGSLFYGGTGLWQGWIHKITHHYVAGSSWNIGFQPMVDVVFSDGVPSLINPLVQYREAPAMLYLHYAITWGVRGLLLIPSLYFIQWMADDEAVGFGFVFLFFLLAPTYYYFIILIVPFALFAARIESVPFAIGAIYMLAVGLTGHLVFSGIAPLKDVLVMFRGWKQYFQTYYYMSWLISGTALYMVALAAANAYRKSADRQHRAER